MSTSPTRCCHCGLVRLATLNVFGLSGNWSDRLVVLRNGFLALDADVVTLQETMVRAEVDQAAEILGPGFQLAHASHREANGSGITTATRWPLGRVVEVDLHVTERTHEFACTCLVTEILAPQPYGRIWLANYLPDYQVDHERERRLQAVTLARVLDGLAAEQAGHVIVAGDMDADSAACRRLSSYLCKRLLILWLGAGFLRFGWCAGARRRQAWPAGSAWWAG